MDSPFMTTFFRSLFHCRACLNQPTTINRLNGIARSRTGLGVYGVGRRHYGIRPPKPRDVAWQPRQSNFIDDMSEEFQRYPMVTAELLRSRKERPKRVKMLVRDFIDDALYNPHYGYFSKEAVIFQAGEPFDFNSYQDALAFHKAFGDRYTEFEDKLDAIQHNELRQLWHTPTELFQPYYGEAVARYLVANYKLSLYPYHDLILYEMGAGNGTLMRNIMDCIRRTDPDVYQRTQYKIIEISPQLAALQRAKVGEHEDHVEIVNRSIFDWNVPVHNPVYFIAMEVFDNFAHDMLRYDPFTEKALQGIVLIDDKGDFYEFYTPQLDPVADRYLRLRKSAFRRGLKHPLNTPRFIRNLRTKLPFHSNLTEPEFIPTALMSFFDVLRNYFPNHRLLASDFHSLPDAVEGVNAPVVQTRYQRTMVPVSTVFVEQGYFDILFPTDFEAMEDMYQALTGKLTRVMKHEEFAKSWADLEATETRSGENPLLQYYQNASVLSSV